MGNHPSAELISPLATQTGGSEVPKHFKIAMSSHSTSLDMLIRADKQNVLGKPTRPIEVYSKKNLNVTWASVKELIN